MLKNRGKRTRLLVKSSTEDKMAEVTHESADVIAKEITLAIIPLIPTGADTSSSEALGKRYSKLFKTILQHVKEAVIDQKFE